MPYYQRIWFLFAVDIYIYIVCVCIHLLRIFYAMAYQVLHGCDSDIHWLQKDFGLYIVNLFDTGQAARVLEYPRCVLVNVLYKPYPIHLLVRHLCRRKISFSGIFKLPFNLHP